MQNDKKFVEVLTEVVKELMNSSNNGDMKETEKKVVESLVKKGYELTEISDVLENIFSIMNTNKVSDFKLRLIQPQEVEHFTDEARSYLFGLRNTGAIDEKQFEELLGIFSTMNQKVGVDLLITTLQNKGILETKKIIVQ